MAEIFVCRTWEYRRDFSLNEFVLIGDEDILERMNEPVDPVESCKEWIPNQDPRKR